MNRRRFLRGLTLTAAGLWVPSVMGQRARRLGGGQLWAAGAVAFDGASYGVLGQAVLPDGQTCTVSMWVCLHASSNDASSYALLRIQTGTSAGTLRLYVSRTSSGRIWVQANNSSSTQIISVYTGFNKLLAASGWTHLFLRFNLASTNDINIAVNGVDATGTISTFTKDQTADFTPSTNPYAEVGNGSTSAAASALYGSLSEMWMSDTDLTSVGYSLFRNGNRPADIGRAGVVGGVTPRLYLSRSMSEPVTSFFTNRGSSGGSFTLTGPPTIDSSTVAK